MRRKSLLNGCVVLAIMTLLIGSEWEIYNKESSVQIESRRLIQNGVCYVQPTISELAPAPESGDDYKEFFVTPNPVTVGEEKKTNCLSGVNKDNIKKYKYNFSKKETKILQRIVEAECTSQSLEAKKNVASVVINRVYGKGFPDTIKGVVFQHKGNRYQFSPVKDGRYYMISITKETIKAVDEVLVDGVINDALYFANESDIKSLRTQKWFRENLIFLFEDDSGHSFYK